MVNLEYLKIGPFKRRKVVTLNCLKNLVISETQIVKTIKGANQELHPLVCLQGAKD